MNSSDNTKGSKEDDAIKRADNPPALESITPFVSIVVPLFNVELYAKQCFDSIASQTFTDFECIVVDDGSTDSSGTIADDMATKDSRFQVIHTENRGLSMARNTGIDVARGTYITFADSDDFYDKRWIEELVNTAEKTNAPITMCDYYDYIEDPNSPNNPIVTGKCSFDDIKSTIIDEHDYWKYFYSGDRLAFLFVWNKLYKRELFENQRFKPKIQYEDVDLAHRITALAKTVALIKEPLCFYRRRSESITSSDRPGRYLDQCEALLNRSHHFKKMGWVDIWDENALYFIGRVARTSIGIEKRDPSDQQLYAICLKEARKQAREILHRHWKERRFATRALAFLINESLYVRLSS